MLRCEKRRHSEGDRAGMRVGRTAEAGDDGDAATGAPGARRLPLAFPLPDALPSLASAAMPTSARVFDGGAEWRMKETRWQQSGRRGGEKSKSGRRRKDSGT